MSAAQAHRERGAALVEMAIILPILLLLILGLVEFARGFNARITMTHATREGVRVLAISGDSGAAVSATRAAIDPLDPAQLSVSTSPCDPGSPTSVTATYPFTYTIIFFGSGTITLETTAVMRCGG